MRFLSAAWNFVVEGVATLAIRNGTTAQILNLYNTYTSDTVYERGFMRFVSNVFEIGTEHVGASLRSTRIYGNTVLLTIAGSAKYIFGSASFTPATASACTIGSSAVPWLTGYFSSYVRLTPVAVGSLTAAATAGTGAKHFVNDALTPVFGSTVAAGGAVTVPVYSDGTNWKVG